jgi:hypothetical protein
MENKELEPKEYFDIIKYKKNNINEEGLQKVYDNCLVLLNKYKITGQVKGMKKLIYHLETIEKERKIVKMGVDTFIYRDDIEEYIDSISKDVVKIIELENYEREIPDEIVDVINKTKNIFTQLYVLFTDYTGKIQKEVERERREQDPILFGTFQDEGSGAIIDRFYFLGDWSDEYCDLTLDKMVNKVKEKENKDIKMNIKTPSDIEELKAQLQSLDMQNDRVRIVHRKKNIFNKIRTFLNK